MRVKKFIWKTGDDFAGAHNQLQDNIRENELFISTLVKLKINIIKSFTNWLGSGWRGISLGSEDFDRVSITVIQDASIYVFNELLKQALNIVQKSDTGLSRIELKRNLMLRLTTTYMLYITLMMVMKSSGFSMKSLLVLNVYFT